MGEQAVNRLMQIIAGEKKIAQVELKAELIIGPSTAI
jgi:DNA-binding LacI/PurR family transcriptional regulator